MQIFLEPGVCIYHLLLQLRYLRPLEGEIIHDMVAPKFPLIFFISSVELPAAGVTYSRSAIAVQTCQPDVELRVGGCFSRTCEGVLA